jgi:nitrite reductase/ring-hydroxylating ferredoxin subunit
MFSKLKFSLFITFSSFLLSACSKENADVIPDVYVDFTIDLLDPEFVTLGLIGASDSVDAKTNNWGYKSAGYDGNGIIVYCSPDEYYAYDRTCPHDFASSGLSIKVKIDLGIAMCPYCNTKYALSTYGTPVSGPGKYPLKNYKTSFEDNRFIRVWNQ